MENNLMIFEKNVDKVSIERVMGIEEVRKIEENELLQDFPKTRAYIKACVSYFSTSNEFIKKSINNRQQIENTLADYCEFDIDLSASRHYTFNKSRPTPMQIIAMLTGEKDGDLKKREIQKNKEVYSSTEKYDNIEKLFISLRLKALTEYSKDNQRQEVITQTNSYCLNILDEIMEDFIELQAYILSFTKNYVPSCGVGLSSYFHEISAVRGEEPSYPLKCFTTFLRSDFFKDEVIKRNRIAVKIPTAFIDFVIKKCRETKNMVYQEVSQEKCEQFETLNFDFLKRIENSSPIRNQESTNNEGYSRDNLINVFGE